MQSIPRNVVQEAIAEGIRAATPLGLTVGEAERLTEVGRQATTLGASFDGGCPAALAMLDRLDDGSYIAWRFAGGYDGSLRRQGFRPWQHSDLFRVVDE